MIDIAVKLRHGPYQVKLGSGLIGRLPALLATVAPGARVFVVCDVQVYALYHAALAPMLKRLGGRPGVFVLPQGERAKSAAVLGKLHAFLLDEQISRGDLLLAIGGGVTSDLVGFAAATVLRGIRYATLSTTLLGMVDAAVGGKTGINHRCGKNLIGAFWQPSLVVCDTDLLATLDRRQLLCGIGEIAKYAGLSGSRMMVALERIGPEFFERDLSLLTPLIEPSIRYKARIVAADEREQGRRMLLNLGHTFGHALETAAGHGRLLHGEAVIMGLWAAVDLSCRLDIAKEGGLDRYRRVLERLIARVPRRKLTREGVVAAMRWDKKRAAVGQKYVLLQRPGRPIIVDSVAPRLVRASLDGLLRIYHTAGR